MPIVVTPKKDMGDIRMCVDLSRLNKYVRRERYQSATPFPGSRRHCCQQCKNLQQIRCNKGLPSMPIGRRKPAPYYLHHTVWEVQVPLAYHLPYSRKYWRELNLAVGSQTAIAKALADFNLVVRYGITIHIYVSKNFWQILIWRLLS